MQNTNPHKTIFNWSGGKDSSLALYEMLKNPEYSIDGLLTNVNSALNRISMHGVRLELIQAQVDGIGIPLSTLNLPEQPGMEHFNRITSNKLAELKEKGFSHAVYGDIFLEDLKKYREQELKKAGFQPVFPLWQRDTTELVHEFIDAGFKAIVVCIKSDLLDKSFCGRILDHNFIYDLPDNVDPCGENGEFHTFVFDGPVFRSPISFIKGEVVFKEYKAPKRSDSHSKKTNPEKMGFWFCDLLPA